MVSNANMLLLLSGVHSLGLVEIQPLAWRWKLAAATEEVAVVVEAWPAEQQELVPEAVHGQAGS
jgi:hypothetical protein